MSQLKHFLSDSSRTCAFQESFVRIPGTFLVGLLKPFKGVRRRAVWFMFEASCLRSWIARLVLVFVPKRPRLRSGSRLSLLPLSPFSTSWKRRWFLCLEIDVGLEDSQTHPGSKNSGIHQQGISIYFTFLGVFCNGFGQGVTRKLCWGIFTFGVAIMWRTVWNQTLWMWSVSLPCLDIIHTFKYVSMFLHLLPLGKSYSGLLSIDYLAGMIVLRAV